MVTADLSCFIKSGAGNSAENQSDTLTLINPEQTYFLHLNCFSAVSAVSFGLTASSTCFLDETTAVFTQAEEGLMLRPLSGILEIFGMRKVSAAASQRCTEKN